MTKTIATLACVIFICSGALASDEYFQKQLKSHPIEVTTAVLFPASVRFEDVDGNSREPATTEEVAAVQNGARFSDALTKVVESTLLHRGVLTINPSETAKCRKEGNLNSDQIDELQKAYDVVDHTLRESGRGANNVSKGKVTIGHNLQGLGFDHSCTLVFVRAHEQVISKGKGLLAAIMDTAAEGPFVTWDVALVDSTTGNVVFYSTDVSRQQLDKVEGSEFKEAIQKSLNRIPIKK